MRILFPLLFAMMLALAPRLAPAQQRATPTMDMDVVALETVESTGEAPRRSAFGRVMDVMIDALVAQQAHTPATAAAVRAPATGFAPRAAERRAAESAGKRAQPRIEITLGERFALPPATATAVATQDAGTPE